MRQLIQTADQRLAAATPADVLAEARAMMGRTLVARRHDRPAPKTLAARRRELDTLQADVDVGIEESDELLRADRKARRLRSPAFSRCRLAVAEQPALAGRVAYHEAGHAVAAYIEGRDVLAVALHFDSRSGFHGEGGCSVDGPMSAFVLLAGIAAERVARSCGAITETSADSCWRHDRMRAQSTLPVGADIRLEAAKAQDRLRPYWPAIRAVGALLLRDIDIDGGEVAQIIRATRTLPNLHDGVRNMEPSTPRPTVRVADVIRADTPAAVIRASLNGPATPAPTTPRQTATQETAAP